MAKAITVKVATPKVIKALETKLDSIKKDYASQEAKEAKFQKTLTDWNKAISKIAIANVSKAENLRTNYRSWNKTLNIDFDITISEDDLPKMPERDFTTMNKYTFDEIVEDISNALSILRMTDEETVNASTMKSIAKYL
jgi:DNA repair exonuclease SbcCD ATPase subunit